ncbi:hypothetical protein P3F01_15525 [Clostridium perfringens]|uniref:hypothetical protein n=1 Tax=Clostridium perfringens TaxID=1502 RepID=UPI0028E0E80C|nr:hypothetical protein [Clostridium perfringens]MDT9337769.1 hypothetical protein [Clostridium perfringens]MDT9345526.1 hypothetical protein [Clostridium perfringens]MDT9348769.1 hypothetical protein [Clostridium perfringens]MDT9354629.1 hypothetical protein [Clostridium perfringens]
MQLKELEKFLKDYTCLECKIRNIELELQEYNEALITGVDTSRETISKTYKISSTVEDATIRKEKLEKELNFLMMMNKKMKNIIECLDEKEKHLLDTYTNVTTNREIATLYNVTETAVCRWKKKVLIKINNLLYLS